MRTKIVEYVHEYDEADWEYDNVGFVDGKLATERVYFTSHVEETYYAVKQPDISSTNREGKKLENSIYSSWLINGSTLVVYSKVDIDGLIGLLEKLRDEEFPEEKKEIVTFGD